MKKEIVVNASKDRARIALLEEGELVELYVEHPDNVRTIGNIHLARIRKVMPAIRAAFVDIGQKQDAFLHFSDLTDNLPELLALAGEDVPGYTGRALSHAPKKRVADDENEPDIEDKLELEDPESSTKRSSGSRKGRSRRRGGGGRSRGGRGRSRREEEEEQEEAGKEKTTSPFVIDLTLKTGKVEPKAPPAEKPSRSTNGADTDADAPSEDASEQPRSRGRSRPKAKPSTEEDSSKEAEANTSQDAPQDAGAEGAEERSSSDGHTSSNKRRRRGRRGGRRRSGARRRAKQQADADGGADTPEAETSPENTEAKGTAPSRNRRGRGRSESDKRSADDTPKAEADAHADDNAQAERSPSGRRGRSGQDRSDRDRSKRDRSDQTKRSSQSKDAEADEAASAKPSTQDNRRSSSGRRDQRGSGRSGRGREDASNRGQQDTRSDGPTKRPEEYLRRDSSILVKITKEPISNKGSRVSTDISLAGRFLVLVPAADYVAVSKKIESARERRRLRTLAQSLKPDRFGVIVRTVADGRDAKTLDTDLRLLLDKWRKIESQIGPKANPPILLYEDVNMVSSIIRDLFTDDYDRILVDDPRLHKNLKAYIQAVAPQMADKVVLHRSNTPVFRAVGIEKTVEQVFSPRVSLPSGGYLFIEHTEAMHVVDVNSGRAGRGKSQAENLLSVNLEAAREVAKQLRLRDLGGIIVVDFIDMRSEGDRRKVYNELKKQFKRDRAVTKLLPMSDFGLIEITRQRLRPSITATATAAVTTDDDAAEARDPAAAMAAAGAAEIVQPERDFGPETLDAPVTAEEVVERLGAWLKHYRDTVSEKHRHRPILVRTHPLLAAHLKRGFPSTLTRWRFRLNRLRFRLSPDPTLHPLDFEVTDEKSGKSLTSKYTPNT